MKKPLLFLILVLFLTGGTSVQAQSGDCASPTTTRPGGVEARNITANAATIHWNAVPGARGYAISVGSADLDPKTWPTYNACKPAEMRYTVAGLVPGKTYRARVRALCESCFRSFGPSVTQWSQDIEFTTLNGSENQNPQGPPVPNFPVLIQDPTQQPGDYVINWPGKPNPPTDPEEPNEPVDGRYTIAGYVIDAWHRPVAGARVKRGSVETLTDAKGRFALTVLETRPAATTPVLVVVEKEGYWRNASRQYLHAQDTTETMLMLREQVVTNRVDAKKGGEMLYKRFSLQLPPNGVQTEDGTPYTGTILLSVDGATPAERDFGLRMPGGDFAAIDANNNDVMLYSYGFLSAEMTTESGQKLEFRPGAEATLRFNLPWNETHRPDSVPLWHFNETTAIWEQEGWSVKNGSIYEGRVRHFSSWNCDWPAERGTVKGRVLDCNDQPVKGGWVDVGQRHTHIDINGDYWSFVPGGIAFRAWTASDTLRDTTVPAQQERTLEDLEGFSFSGLAIYDWRTQTLIVHLLGSVPENLSLSIDGGQTWTQQRDWTGLSKVPGTVHLNGACPTFLRVLTPPKQEDCRKLTIQEQSMEALHSSLENALNADRAYYLNLHGRFTGDWRLLLSLGCLHSLHMHTNQLTSLPEDIGSLVYLRTLSLGMNQLTSLPTSFGNLIFLQTLNLIRNQLTSMPESFGNLASLQTLTLDGNQLSSLPGSFGNLVSLQELKLDNNRLTALPESFGNLASLQDLYLRGNQLTDLPASIANLAGTLRFLYLYGNPIPVSRRAAIQAMLPNTTIYW